MMIYQEYIEIFQDGISEEHFNQLYEHTKNFRKIHNYYIRIQDQLYGWF